MLLPSQIVVQSVGLPAVQGMLRHARNTVFDFFHVLGEKYSDKLASSTETAPLVNKVGLCIVMGRTHRWLTQHGSAGRRARLQGRR